MITSLQHPLVKHLVKLRHNRDYREEQGTCVVEGAKMVAEIGSKIAPECVLARDPSFVSGIKPKEIFIVPEEILEKITGTPSPDGVIAEIAFPEPASLKGKMRILALDGISDPGNLGTLLRTALALGWDGVFLFHDYCDPFNDKALRAAKGATFRLPIASGSYEELKAVAARENLPLYAADLQGISVNEVQLPTALILVLGSEAHGLSSQVKKEAQLITLPQKGDIDSLNVAVAGGILMYLVSQR